MLNLLWRITEFGGEEMENDNKVHSIAELLATDRHFAIYVLARYMYCYDEPIMGNPQYTALEDALHVVLGDNAEFMEYYNRTYDDDPVPTELLAELGIKPIEMISTEGRSEYFASLNEDKSMSIDSVTDYRGAYDFMQERRKLKQDVMTSIKMDGINTKTLFVDGEFKLALSRGRSAISAFDFTDKVILQDKFNTHLPTDVKELQVFGESFVEAAGLQRLRDRYNADGYKTNKSAAISLLRVKHGIEDYHYLHTKIFAAEGLASTQSETFRILEKSGFDVTPYKLVKWEEIPADYDEFKAFLKKNVFSYLHDEQVRLTIPADGVVLEVNDMSWGGTTSGKYCTRQLACKFEHWAFDYYKGIVTNIVFTQKRVSTSVRVEIEPMETNDGCKARVINIFNPGILISNHINVGTEVTFERNAGAVNVLIHGVRLQGLEDNSQITD